MKKAFMVVGCIIGALLLVFGCVIIFGKHFSLSVIGGADGPTAVFVTGSTNGIVAAVLVLIGVVLLAAALICHFRKRR